MSTPLPISLWLLSASLAVPAAGQLAVDGAQLWHAGTAGLTSALQSNARFGATLAAADFNCDGFDDLAVGIPFHDEPGGAADEVGQVLVLYSSGTGLDAAGHQLWDQTQLAATEGAAGDRFGFSLAAGDFDGDACSDLVVGIPDEDIGAGAEDAGAIQVIYGSPLGLSALGNSYLRQGASGVQGVAQTDDRFGVALAVGDFDGDGFDDLAIGVPQEDVEATATENAGAVHILFGSAISGLSGAGDVLLLRGSGLPGVPEPNENLGGALAAGRFDAIPGDDLAIGAPKGFVPPEAPDAGLVIVVTDLDGARPVVVLSQDSAGVPDSAENFDNFGFTLAAGNFDGGGLDELAVGAPTESLEEPDVSAAGAVFVLDFDGGPSARWIQNDLPPNISEEADTFGSTLEVGDFDGDGADDLAIGVYAEEVGNLYLAGTMHLLYGERGLGLTAAGAQQLFETLDPVEAGDAFSAVLAAGRFAGHSGMDLAVTAYWESVASVENAGAVNVFVSIALFVDGFENGLTDSWSSTSP